MQYELSAGTETIPNPTPVIAALAHEAPIRIMVVDDHALLRVGVKSALALLDLRSLEVLEAGNLHDAIDLYRSAPDISLVLLDLNMPDCRGLQGPKRFIEAFPEARVVIMSGTQDDFVIGQLRALGAIGYITKGEAPQGMADIVLGLLKGGNDGRRPGRTHSGSTFGFAGSAGYDRVAELGTRHLEILDLVLFGCSNQEISTSTGLSLGTIKNYVSTILLALDVKSRSHLISLFR
jgi:DNA-binding NarL/FixJ family response regulator